MPVSAYFCGKMAESGNLNFQKLCRFCLSREGEMLSITGKDPSNLANSIKDKIQFTTSTKIPFSNEVPAVICINCDILLNGFFIFKKRSNANNLKVEALIQQRYEAENGNFRASKKSVSSFPNKNPAKFHSQSNKIGFSNAMPAECSASETNSNNNLLLDGKRSADANFTVGANRPIIIKTENGKSILEAVKRATLTGTSEVNCVQAADGNGKESTVEYSFSGNDGLSDGGINTPNRKFSDQSFNMSGLDESEEEIESYEDADLLKYLKLEETPNNYFERKQCVSPNGWGVMLIRRCAECGAKFTALSDLRKHKAEMGHSDPQCTICLRTFISPVARDNHMKKKHKIREPQATAEGSSSGKKQRKCTECGDWFPSLGDLRIHKKLLGHSDPTCNICLRKFICKEACERHLRKKHKINKPGSIQNCSICGMGFGKKKDLLAHISVHIGIKNSSTTKVAEVNLDETLESPTSSKKTVPKHLCPICGKGFTKLKSVQQHKNIAHSLSKKDQSYVCPICSKVFHYKKRLEDHVSLHIGFQLGTPVKSGITASKPTTPEVEAMEGSTPASAVKKSLRKKRSRYEYDSDFTELDSSSPDQ